METYKLNKDKKTFWNETYHNGELLWKMVLILIALIAICTYFVSQNPY